MSFCRTNTLHGSFDAFFFELFKTEKKKLKIFDFFVHHMRSKVHLLRNILAIRNITKSKKKTIIYDIKCVSDRFPFVFWLIRPLGGFLLLFWHPPKKTADSDGYLKSACGQVTLLMVFIILFKVYLSFFHQFSTFSRGVLRL